MRKRSGFTLLETAAVVGVVSVLVGVLAPAVKMSRSQARGAGSAANLMFIGQGSAMYAQDNAGRLFSYTWAGPTVGHHATFFEMPDGKTRSAFSHQEAASWQNTEILMRQTGRLFGDDRILNFAARLPHRRYSHLPLMDYLGVPFPSAWFADPADANLMQWQASPADISLANNIPYAAGSEPEPGHENPDWWDYDGYRQRWAFGSSYQRTVSAWNTDGIGGSYTYFPVADSPHFSIGSNSVPLPEGRLFSEIAFPSSKVHFFEEFDRRQAGSPYFAYDHARPKKLMFDGSINDRPSGEARPSWNAAIGKQEWRQTYVPLHTFPLPLGGLGDQTLLSQRYRWTLGGLKGIDYVPGPLMAP
jgi:hypothetical protein